MFLVMLSVLIVLHEYGHFLVARRNGVRVNEFSIGMGPQLFGWTSPSSGTLYSLRALPIGGYCAMQGEDNKTNEAEQQREFRSSGALDDDNFQAKTPWQRLAIVLAGPVANFVLCYVHPVRRRGCVRRCERRRAAGHRHAGQGFARRRRRIALGRSHRRDRRNAGRQRQNADRFDSRFARKELDVSMCATASACDVTSRREPCPVRSATKLGLHRLFAGSHVRTRRLRRSLRRQRRSVRQHRKQTLSSIGLLVTHFSKYVGQTAGPIGMGQAAATIQDWGWGPYFNFAAMISFALGLFNLLPIPALDGGRAAFIIAELLRGKPVDPEKEAMVHFAGFAVLIALMLRVAFLRHPAHRQRKRSTINRGSSATQEQTDLLAKQDRQVRREERVDRRRQSRRRPVDDHDRYRRCR